MAIVFVQKITGNGATVVLNGVVAGNSLYVTDSYYRATSTGAAETVPTDSNGTFLGANVDGANASAGQDVGVGIFYEKNCAAGTHTVTPQANTAHNTTLSEFSGLDTVTLLDKTAAAGSGSGTGTSQATGTTPVTSVSNELVIIAFCMGDSGVGSTNVGLTDPVANFTSLFVIQDDQADLATNQAYRIISATGAQSATFNWTVSHVSQWWDCDIATFATVAGVIASSGAYAQESSTSDRYQLEDGSGVYLIEPFGGTGVFLPPFFPGDLTGIGTPGRYFKDRLG